MLSVLRRGPCGNREGGEPAKERTGSGHLPVDSKRPPWHLHPCTDVTARPTHGAHSLQEQEPVLRTVRHGGLLGNALTKGPFEPPRTAVHTADGWLQMYGGGVCSLGPLWVLKSLHGSQGVSRNSSCSGPPPPPPRGVAPASAAAGPLEKAPVCCPERAAGWIKPSQPLTCLF